MDLWSVFSVFVLLQSGYNVLHRVSKGLQGSVDTMKWLFEVMPHLQSPHILNLKTKVRMYISLNSLVIKFRCLCV